MELSGKAARYLRSLGHALDPVVSVGKDGATKGVIGAVDRALLDHELIKVRIHQECPMGPRDSADLLAIQTSSAVAQILGRTILLYRPHPEKPRIQLPVRGGQRGPDNSEES
ncbi:MAG TPA: ribosome assembly RNA-binding protein YhbY [Polyangiaceae bacterium]|nr:ribosome assembly RNA-binding protein YhbY [Polyangiaceae bacterium]